MYEYFGYGKTTKALASHFGAANFYDDNVKEKFCDEDGNTIYPSSAYKPNTTCTQVPSPGINPTNPLILQAVNLMSEYDVFASTMPKSVWVSGTNGKTTTTSMIEHLLSEDGAVSGGNIGNPLG
ncbi:MAG: Mur ligase family protein, partial [Campylobacterota bacterium]|nr:Mur ligase family protein [Campylobacterota bacterium]